MDIEILSDNNNIEANGIELATCKCSCECRDEVDGINDSKHGYLGCDIEESSDDILICEYIYLLEHVKDIRKDYELCLLRNREEYEKYNKVTDFVKFLSTNADLDDNSWLLETEVYSGLANELIERGYFEYIDVLWHRYMEK